MTKSVVLAKAETTQSQREIINAVNMLGEEANLAFNESYVLSFEKPLNKRSFEKSVERLVKRHDSLRMTFNDTGSHLYLHEYLNPAIEWHSLDSQEELEKYKLQMVSEPFDLQEGPLLRFILTENKQGKFHCIVCAHHVICDGWSYAVLLEDLAALYGKAEGNKNSSLLNPEYFIDYLRELQSESYLLGKTQDLKFWKKVYKTHIDPLDMPTTNSRPTSRSLKAGYLESSLSVNFSSDIKNFCKSEKITLTSFLMGSFVILINRLTLQDDISIALPSSGQASEGMLRVVGHCVNTLPVRLKINNNDRNLDVIKKTMSQFFSQSSCSRLTFGELIASSNVKRLTDRLALSSIAFNLDQDLSSSNFDGNLASLSVNPRVFENFEIFLNVVDDKEKFILQIQYSSSLFSKKRVSHWVDVLEKIMKSIIDYPETKINETVLVGQDEIFYSGAKNKYPSLSEGLFESFYKYSDAPAIIYQDQVVKYSQLNSKLSKCSEFLHRNGVKSGDYVGICIDRSEVLVIWILSCWKIGAAYIPIDPNFPQKRLDYIVETSDPKVIISSVKNSKIFPNRIILSEKIDNEMSDARELVIPRFSEEIPAVVIFTSGSTGQPKGVVVTRKGISNLLQSTSVEPGMNSSDKLLAVTTVSFDMSILEFFLPLWVGGACVIASAETAKNPEDIASSLNHHNITVMQATPTTWRALMGSSWAGSEHFKMITGGEPFPYDIKETVMNKCGSVWDYYGPTETTVYACGKQVTRKPSFTIGKPINNTELFVVDPSSHQLLPIGAKGELVVGGDGVALGYINQKQLTDERFINCFSEGDYKLYKTGDLAKWSDSEEIQYLGRIDNQVKIRGFRIEIGEIESLMSAIKGVEQVVITVNEKSIGDKRLIAYYSTHDEAITEFYLREQAKLVLPQYMYPNAYQKVDFFPKTPNGKVDRKGLIDEFPLVYKKPVALEGPVSKYEEELISLWVDMIGNENINIMSNFFESGGHSLLAVDFVLKIKKKYNVDIPMNSLMLDNLSGISKLLNKCSESPEIDKGNSSFIVKSLSHKSMFFGKNNKLYGNYHTAGIKKCAILVCQPLAHEYTTSHRVLKQLSDKVALKYGPCLRFDYFGTGDSYGADTDLNLNTIRRDVNASIEYLKFTSGCEKIIVLTSRMLSASILQLNDNNHVNAIIEWDVVDSIDQHFKTLRQLNKAALNDLNRYYMPREISVYPDSEEIIGFRYSKTFIKQLLEADCQKPLVSHKPLLSLTTGRNYDSVQDQLAPFEWYSLLNIQVSMTRLDILSPILKFIGEQSDA